MILEPPQFAGRAAPELGRVEQDAVVAPLAAHFARGELGGVVDDPADRPLAHPRQHGVGAAALDRFLRGVDMDHPRAGVGQRQRADPGIAEQVEHVGVVADRARIKSHCGAMSGKKPRWRNGVRLAWKRTLPRASGQLGGTGAMLDPAPAALLVRSGDEGRVGRPIVERRRPHRLRFGADDGDAP